MKDKYIYIALVAYSSILVSCGGNTPTPPAQTTYTFTDCYVEQYGAFYDSLPYNIFALDLYSEGLSLDSTRHITGSGSNLYISDIFLKDSLLATGTYISDTTATDHTFLPGHNFEGTPTGIYLLSIAESSVAAIQVIDSGQISIAQTADSLYNMHFTLYYGKQEYEAHFEGKLHYYDRR